MELKKLKKLSLAMFAWKLKDNSIGELYSRVYVLPKGIVL